MKLRIRFNVNHRGSGLVWRVFEERPTGDVEFQVSNITINVPCFGEERVEDDKFNGVTERKWNICCDGVLRVTDGHATIDAE